MEEAVVTHERQEKDWKKKKKHMEDEEDGKIYQGNEGAIEASSASSGMICWENYVAKMVLRVLLVEADDSTRQIITALLRKCSYRVAAVADGLMAWEALKEKPHNIDLVLTEVDLPSISGYALLTLAMEHDACKNIPVIMMSSHDSVGMVLKCLLKGAADFLVKPIRKNELRNLWQHVWRRQSLNDGLSQSSPVVLEKIEATSENHVPSNHSSICTTSSGKIKNHKDDSQEHFPERRVAFPNFAWNEMQKQDWSKCIVEEKFTTVKESDVSKAAANYGEVVQSCEGLGDSTSRNKIPPKEETLFEENSTLGMHNRVEDQRHLLNHSQASAFSWYSSNIPRTAPSLFYPQSTLSSVHSPSFPSKEECPDEKDKSSDQTGEDEPMEDGLNGSFVAGPPNGGSICNSFPDHKTAYDSTSIGDSQRKSIREAALAKFRLKRKERCFEKKVRYKSRQKLAEQRPRVKGQFVRHLQNVSPAPPDPK